LNSTVLLSRYSILLTALITFANILAFSTVKVKELVVDEIKKKVIAFANRDGGTLYVGVTDSGEVVGLADADLMDINNMLRDGIKPDITLFTQSRIEKSNGKSIIAVQVQRGTNRPYYLADKGIRPKGVFIRHGTSAVPTTDTAIRKMIRETDGESFEVLRFTAHSFVGDSISVLTKNGSVSEYVIESAQTNPTYESTKCYFVPSPLFFQTNAQPIAYRNRHLKYTIKSSAIL